MPDENLENREAVLKNAAETMMDLIALATHHPVKKQRIPEISTMIHKFPELKKHIINRFDDLNVPASITEEYLENLETNANSPAGIAYKNKKKLTPDN